MLTAGNAQRKDSTITISAEHISGNLYMREKGSKGDPGDMYKYPTRVGPALRERASSISCVT